MSFDFLLWHCIQEGKTSFKDQGTGKTVALRPQNDECVLVCHTDCDVFRRAHGLINQKASDVLFFAKKKGATPILAFVELKSCDCSHAISQIKNVATKIKDKLPRETTYRAVVVLSVASPTGSALKALVKELADIKVKVSFKGGVRANHPPVDIRDLLG